MQIPTRYARLLEGRVIRIPLEEELMIPSQTPSALVFAKRRQHAHETHNATTSPSGTTGRDGGEDPDYVTDDEYRRRSSLFMPQPITVLRGLEAACHQPIEPALVMTPSHTSSLAPLALVFAQRKPCLPPTATGASTSGGEVTGNDGSSTHDPIDDD